VHAHVAQPALDDRIHSYFVGLVAVVGAVGAYNWRILQSRLTEPRGESRLQRSTVLELGFGIVLLGITAVLVALPIPEEMRR